MMEKCGAKYSMRECESTENARVRMNLEQAAEQHNYTEVGFKKVCYCMFAVSVGLGFDELPYAPRFFCADKSTPSGLGPDY